jgi:hypothetical protein
MKVPAEDEAASDSLTDYGSATAAQNNRNDALFFSFCRALA